MDAQELHRWVEAYNWDEGLAPLWPVVESDQTEFATALLIYWRAQGPWLHNDAAEINHEARRMVEQLRERLIAGIYPRGALHYDPVSDLGLTRA